MTKIAPTDFQLILEVKKAKSMKYGDKFEGTFGELRQAADEKGKRLLVKRILSNGIREKCLESMPKISSLCVADIKQQARLTHPNIGTPIAVICSPLVTIYESMEFSWDGLCRSFEGNSRQRIKLCVTLADFISRVREFDLFNSIQVERTHGIQATIALNTATALEFLHSRGLTHGSFAAESVLITNKPANEGGISCKVIDYGEAYRMVRNLINNDVKSITQTDATAEDVRCYGKVLNALLFPIPERGDNDENPDPQTYLERNLTDSNDEEDPVKQPSKQAYLERDLSDSDNDEDPSEAVGGCSGYRPKSEMVDIADMCCRGTLSMAVVKTQLLAFNEVLPSRGSAVGQYRELPYDKQDANSMSEQQLHYESTLVSDLKTDLPQETMKPSFKTVILGSCLRDNKQKADVMPIYKLPLEEKAIRTSTKSRVCVVKDPNAKLSNLAVGLPRTLLLIGATGAGKSTLIDGLVNYVYDVEWTDDFRFTIIDLKDSEKMASANQAKSQTEWITTYIIRPAVGSKITSELRVVDMPGFGDTAGIEKDNQLAQRLGQLFAVPEKEGGINQVDMVCLVVQAALSRLTISQRYILRCLEEIFDKSIRENVCSFITFADGAKPPVLNALKENKTPYQNFFTFNNSALFERAKSGGRQQTSRFAEMFWDMGKESYADMFKVLLNMQTKSLQLSKAVLDKRTQLSNATANIQRLIEEGLSELDSLLQEKRILKQHQQEAEANKNFTYNTTETKNERQAIKDDEYVTNCLECNTTCHFPCKIKANGDKARCAAMDADGNCEVCIKKCPWGRHTNDGVKYELVDKIVTKTYEDIKKKHYDATKGGDIHQNMVANMKKKFMKTQKGVQDLMDRMLKCQEELSKIALADHSPLSKVEFLQMMRETEEREKKAGYKKRVQMLNAAIDEFSTMIRISGHKFNPWEKYIDQPELMGDIKAVMNVRRNMGHTQPLSGAQVSSPLRAVRQFFHGK